MDSRVDVALLALRVCFGGSMAWHGINKVRGPRGLAGTAGWFDSIGMRSPRLNAALAATTEIVAGLLFAAGLVTPLAAAAIIGLMVVAIATVHWRVGYFVFLPDQGWEYCFAIAVVAASVAWVGPGDISVDAALSLDAGWGTVAVPLGIAAAVVQLSLFWRPSGTSRGS